MNNIHQFQYKKEQKEKISMLTCYDYTTATILAKTDIDALLVGDSAAMVMHGYENTTYATLEMMVLHTRAVKKGAPHKLIIADMPFLSYRKSLSETMDAALQLIQAGANAIKLEGATGNIAAISHLVESGIPVMGHLGLTPQHIHQLGGYHVQGQHAQSHLCFIQQAESLQAAGCFSLVLECVPAILAKKITDTLQISTIGIGAGLDTNGQILVLHDLLGLQSEIKPRFLKTYLNGHELVQNSIHHFVQEVRAQIYPSAEYAY